MVQTSPNIGKIVDTFIEHYFDQTPVFYKLGRNKTKLEIKGIVGVLDRQNVGLDNSVITIPFTRFYTAFIDNVIDAIVDYRLDSMMVSDEDEKSEKPDADILIEKIRKHLNLKHYFRADKFTPNAHAHNRAYTIRRTNIIAVMYKSMSKRIKQFETII